MFGPTKAKHTAVIFFSLLVLGVFAQASFARADPPPAQCNPETDLSCPRIGGLVPCGRNSDDPSTRLINEREQCAFCHFFYLGDNIITFLFSKLLPVIAMFFVVISGVLIIISRGNPNQLKLGREMAIWTLTGLAIVLISFVLANTFFTALGVKKWTGLVGSRGTFETVVSPKELKDEDRTGNREWQANEWQDTLITLRNQSWQDREVRLIVGNTKNSVTFDEGIPAVTGDISYTIGGWWQFACGISKPEPVLPAPLPACPNLALEPNSITFSANCSEFPICTTENTVELEWRSPQGRTSNCQADTDPIQNPPIWSGAKDPNGTAIADISTLALPASVRFGIDCNVDNAEVFKSVLVKKDQVCAPVQNAPVVNTFQIQTNNEWFDGPGPFIFSPDHPLAGSEKRLELPFKFQWVSENSETCKGVNMLQPIILEQEKKTSGESISLFSVDGLNNLEIGKFRYGIVCSAGNFSDSKTIDVCNENCNQLVR